jgi:hypothetical protein
MALCIAPEPLPDWVTQLAPQDEREAWVARQRALVSRHVWALLLYLTPAERAHWDESWRAQS